MLYYKVQNTGNEQNVYEKWKYLRIFVNGVDHASQTKLYQQVGQYCANEKYMDTAQHLENNTDNITYVEPSEYAIKINLNLTLNGSSSNNIKK